MTAGRWGSLPGAGTPPRPALTVHGLLLIAAVALPLALAALSAWSSRHAAWHEATGELRRDATAIAEYAGRVLDSYRQADERIADLLRDLPEPAIAARRPALEAALRDILAGLPDARAAAVTGADDRPLVSILLDPAAASPPVLEALQAVLRGAGAGATIAPLATPAVEGGGTLPGLVVALAGRDPGAAIRAVGVAVDSAEVAVRLALLANGPEDVVTLVQADGAVLARAAPAGAPQPSGRVDARSGLVTAFRSGAEHGTGRGPSALDGVDRLVAFRRVQGWPVYAVVARPTALVGARWREAMALPVLLGLASAALLALLGGLVWRNRRALEDANQLLEARVAARTAEVAEAIAAQRAGDERLRLAIEAAGFGTWEMDLRAGTMRRSGLLVPEQPDLPLAGYTLEGHLDLVHPEDRPTVEQLVAAMASGRETRARAEYRVRLASGAWIWMESYGGVVERDEASGTPLRIAGVSRDVTERRQAEAALRASETRLRVALEAARFSSWEYDVAADRGSRQGELTATVPQVPRAGFGLAAWLAAMHPDDRDRAEAGLRALIAGTAERMLAEIRVRRHDGAWASIETAGAVAERDPRSGAVLRIAGVARDVTEQREAALRQTLLAREVDHRAKNALAVVQAALRLTPKTDAASYAAAVEGRVRSLARAHTLLAETRWAGASLQAVASAELSAFLSATAPGAPARATLSGPDLTLSPAAAQGLSMTLHELATNATKYGALSSAGGRVALGWELDDAAGLLRLRWAEKGGPPVAAAPERRGFGSRIVEATVRDQLGGRLERHWEPQGLVCEIALPLARALGSAAPQETAAAAQ